MRSSSWVWTVTDSALFLEGSLLPLLERQHQATPFHALSHSLYSLPDQVVDFYSTHLDYLTRAVIVLHDTKGCFIHIVRTVCLSTAGALQLCPLLRSYIGHSLLILRFTH